MRVARRSNIGPDRSHTKPRISDVNSASSKHNSNGQASGSGGKAKGRTSNATDPASNALAEAKKAAAKDDSKIKAKKQPAAAADADGLVQVKMEIADDNGALEEGVRNEEPNNGDAPARARRAQNRADVSSCLVQIDIS